MVGVGLMSDGGVSGHMRWLLMSDGGVGGHMRRRGVSRSRVTTHLHTLDPVTHTERSKEGSNSY